MTRTNPYVGPKAFQRKDQHLFYGRDYEVQKLLNLLIAEQVLLLHAPSGAGKTSLINAALRPKLEEEENFLVLPVMRVSRLLPSKILEQLDTRNRYVFSALLSLEKFKEDEAASHELSPEELARLKQLAEMTFLDYLKEVSERQERKRLEARNALAQTLNQPPRDRLKPIPSQMVLIFDQFEEILSVDPTDNEIKTEFFKQVGDALFTDEYWALFSMREDYAASLGSLVRQLPTRLETRFRLELLTTTAAHDAIKEPAQSQHVTFQEDAVDKLIEDLRTVKVQSFTGKTEEKQGEFVEPMQLQVVCYRLWEKLGFPEGDDEKQITIHDLKGTHVNEALAEFYESCLAQITEKPGGKSEEEIRQWIENELITSGGTRGMVFMSQTEAAGMPRKIVEALEERHLLRGEYRAGARWYELTHDRFIEPIKESNRPWALMRVAAKRATRKQIMAATWFLALAILWLFAEFFVTEPVRESRAWEAKQKSITEGLAIYRAKGVLVNDAIEAAKKSDEEKLKRVLATISSKRQELIAESKAGRPGLRPGKEARKNLDELNQLESAAQKGFAACKEADCSTLDETITKIKQASEKNWKDFKGLTDAEIGALEKLVNPPSPPSAEKVKESFTDARLRRALHDFSKALRGRSIIGRAEGVTAFEVLSLEQPDKKLVEGINRLKKASNENDWTGVQVEVRVFETAANILIQLTLEPLDRLSRNAHNQFARLRERDSRNRGLLVVNVTDSNKRYQELPYVQEKYSSLFFDHKITAVRATAILYLVWCVFLTVYMVYLARASRNLAVGLFYFTLRKPKGIADLLGWNIKSRRPSVTAIVALACLLLIHLRVSWICYNVLKSSAAVNLWITSVSGLIFWRLMVVAGVLLVITFIAFYVISRHVYGRRYEQTFRRA